MHYTIQELDEFSIIGQEIKLSNFQKRNIQISTQFWRKFNSNLKKSYLSQSGNWIKYAFMERREGKLYYYCAIPKKIVVPEGFTLKEINSHKYIVVEHIGSLDNIYETYKKVYHDLLPNSNYVHIHDDFLHFEKYDSRFNWDREDSIIEIWIPIQEVSVLREW